MTPKLWASGGVLPPFLWFLSMWEDSVLPSYRELSANVLPLNFPHFILTLSCTIVIGLFQLMSLNFTSQSNLDFVLLSLLTLIQVSPIFCSFASLCNLDFLKKDFIYLLFREKGRECKKEGNINMREKRLSFASSTHPSWRLNPEGRGVGGQDKGGKRGRETPIQERNIHRFSLRHVPWLVIKPATFCHVDRNTNRATQVRATI